MHIGNRLELVASMVPKVPAAADIGTDHAYVPVYLVRNGLAEKVIASDIVEGPCLAAKETVATFGLKDKIEVRLAPGLCGIKPGEVQAVVIAGMGGGTIKEILSDSPEVVAKASHFVLQPMNHESTLRKWLLDNGFCIEDEMLCCEKSRLYVVIKAGKKLEEACTETGCEAQRESGETSASGKGINPEETGCETKMKSGVLTQAELEIGPCIIKKRPPYFREYVKKRIEIYRSLLAQMGKSAEAMNSERYKNWDALCKSLSDLL